MTRLRETTLNQHMSIFCRDSSKTFLVQCFLICGVVFVVAVDVVGVVVIVVEAFAVIVVAAVVVVVFDVAVEVGAVVLGLFYRSDLDGGGF